MTLEEGLRAVGGYGETWVLRVHRGVSGLSEGFGVAGQKNEPDL
jgi:hypothetical protein